MNNQVKCYKNGEEVTLPLLTITPAELNTMLLSHFGGGGYGWVMVEDIDREFCRIGGFAKGLMPSQAFLVWKPKLKAVQPLEIEVLELATQLRADIESGKKKVVDTHIK